jgi:hypothetical protein
MSMVFTGASPGVAGCRERIEGRIAGGSVADAAGRAGAAGVHQCDVIALDAGLASLAIGAVRRLEGAELERGLIAVAEFPLAAFHLGDGAGIGEHEIEREVIAVPHRPHDRAAAEIAPVVGGHRFRGMIVGDRLADEAVNGGGIEDRLLVAKDVTTAWSRRPWALSGSTSLPAYW